MATARKTEVAQETATNTEAVEAKAYTLRSTNKFLTVASLGVQFMNGKYSTTDPQVARALELIDGVEILED